MLNAIPLNAMEFGHKGRAIILLHGIGEGAFSWLPIAKHLSAYGHAFALDLRGHGDSRWDPQGRYNLDSYLEDVTAFVEQRNLTDFIVVGHSLGAAIAVRLAVDRPKKMCGLGIIDYGPECAIAVITHAKAAKLAEFMAYRDIKEYARLLLEKHPLLDPGVVDAFAANSLKQTPEARFVLKCDPRVLHGQFAEDDADIWDRLRTISCPTILIRGSGSAVLRPDIAKRITSMMHNCTLATVVAGHAVLTDNPAETRVRLQSFIESIPAVERF